MLAGLSLQRLWCGCGRAVCLRGCCTLGTQSVLCPQTVLSMRPSPHHRLCLKCHSHESNTDVNATSFIQHQTEVGNVTDARQCLLRTY